MTTHPSATTLPTREAELPDQARLLDSIFTIAVAHDAKCQRAENELYRAVGSRGPDQAELSPIDRNTWDELEGNYRLTIVELCATVAAAALRRTAPFGAIADELVARGLIVQLSGH